MWSWEFKGQWSELSAIWTKKSYSDVNFFVLNDQAPANLITCIILVALVIKSDVILYMKWDNFPCPILKYLFSNH